MNYQKIYDQLIERGRKRNVSRLINVQNHHILPRSLGGDDGDDNLVFLTPREHFIAHIILVKINPRDIKMKRALGLMKSKGRFNSRRYEWVTNLYQYNIKKEDLILILENNPGISKQKIANIYGCDVSVITERLNRWSISYNKLDIEKCRHYIKNNPTKNHTEIGMVFGVSGNLISRYNKLYDLGLYTWECKNNNKFSKNEITEMINMGYNNEKISKKLLITPDKIRRILNHFNIKNPNNKQVLSGKEKERIVKFIKKNPEVTKDEIMIKYNITYTILYSITKRYNVYVPNLNQKKVEEFRIINKIKKILKKKKEITIKELTVELKLSWDQTRNIIKRYNLLNDWEYSTVDHIWCVSSKVRKVR